jgi:hypothetical protein
MLQINFPTHRKTRVRIMIYKIHCFHFKIRHGKTRDPKTLFQAPATMLIKSVVFWVITRRHVVIIYRRFGTTYRSHLHGSRFQVVKKACWQWNWTLYPPPLSSHWLSSHRTFPHHAMLSSFFVKRISFLLGILTREDGTDTLSRNVGK